MRRILHILLIIVFFVLFQNKIYCQGKKNLPNNDNKILFELNAYSGKIFKHSPKFLPNVTEYSFGFELSASYKTFGNKKWHRALNYPEIGISYVQTHFGDRKIFGNTYGFVPFVKFNIFRIKPLYFYASLGSGLGYITKSYHPEKNPTNNVIGSKINSLIQFKMGFDIHLTKEVDLVLAAAFTHYSNSAIQSPNLGINLPSLNIGAVYKPKQFNTVYNKEEPKYSETFKERRKNEYAFKFSLGVKDREIWGAKFPIYSVAFQYGRYIGYANKLIAGTIVSFDQYEYDFQKEREIHVENNQIAEAMDFSLYGGYEMMLGNVGINFIVGAYLYDNAFKGAPVWAKPGVTYYFTEFGKAKHRPFVGVNIKTHYFIAQYVEVHTGIAF